MSSSIALVYACVGKSLRECIDGAFVPQTPRYETTIIALPLHLYSFLFLLILQLHPWPFIQFPNVFTSSP